MTTNQLWRIYLSLIRKDGKKLVNVSLSNRELSFFNDHLGGCFTAFIRGDSSIVRLKNEIK